MVVSLLGLTIAGFLGYFSGIIVLILIVFFIIFFASCIGPVFWTYVSEIFPNRIRGTALSIPAFTTWACTAILVLVFPAMMKRLDLGVTFGILTVFAIGQLLFAMKYMQETKGKSLEEIEEMWK
jgi:MFS family permease